MKLVVAVVRDEFGSALSEQLSKKGFGATKLASTGGFLKAGNSTFLIGVPAGQMDEVLGVIRQVCPNRSRTKGDAALAEGALKSAAAHLAQPQSASVQVGSAIVFVMNVEKMVKV